MRRSTLLYATTGGFAVAYLVATGFLGSTPDGSDSPTSVATWFAQHGGDVRASLWCTTIGLLFFAVYAALVRAALPAPHRDLFLIGAALFVAETAIQGWIWAGLALHPGAASPETTQTVFSIATYWGPTLTATDVMMFAPVVLLGLTQAGGWPRWIGVLASVAALEQLVETITIFGKHGFIAPGGPMNLYLGAALTGVTLIAIGVVAARLQPTPDVT